MKYAFLLILTALTLQAAPISLRDGESFRYRVSWGIFGGAGEILFSAKKEELEGLEQLKVTTLIQTKGLVSSVYSFRADAESIFDAADGRILAAKASSVTKKKKTRSMSVFDYRAQIVRHVDYLRPERTSDIPMPGGTPMDLITTLVEARTFDMKPGDRRPAVVMFEREFYEITIVAEKYETIDTKWGRKKTLVLKPIMEKNPKGAFKRGSDMHVWITQDERKLPVKFEIELGVGTGVATLEEHVAPKSAK